MSPMTVGRNESSGWASELPVRRNAAVRDMSEGQVLVGGAPPRLIRLTRPLPAGAQLRLPTRLTADLLSYGIVDPALESWPQPVGAVEVVVPVYQDSQRLDRCLHQLSGLSVVVVDDASSDADTVRAVATRHGARLLRLSHNSGPAAARNAGFAATSAQFVAFVDADVTAPAAHIDRLLRHFGDPRLAVVGPRVRSAPTDGSRLDRLERAGSALDMGADSGVVRAWSPVGYLPSACIVVRRCAVEEVGRFAEHMRIGEDVDLVWRLIDHGWLVRYDADIHVHHEPRGSLREWAARRHAYGTGAATLAKRHGPKVAPAVLAPWQLMFLVGLAPARLAWSVPVTVASLAVGLMRARSRLGPGHARLAGRLTLLSSASAVKQGVALLLRHWAPATLTLGTWRPARRTMLAAVALDAVGALRAGSSPTDWVLSRFGDVAYATGVWRGAWRARSVAALTPHVNGFSPV